MLTTLDFAVIAIYFVGVAAFGLKAGGRQSSTADYFLGSRDLPWWAVCFSVVELSSDELAGETLLWGIDTHNRTAHVGISLRPAFRNRGLGTDVLRVLCGYGFAVRGLHRLQLETLADNTAMIQAATRVGFARHYDLTVGRGALRRFLLHLACPCRRPAGRWAHRAAPRGCGARGCRARASRGGRGGSGFRAGGSPQLFQTGESQAESSPSL